jgi:hypothetical protein
MKTFFLKKFLIFFFSFVLYTCKRLDAEIVDVFNFFFVSSFFETCKRRNADILKTRRRLLVCARAPVRTSGAQATLSKPYSSGT